MERQMDPQNQIENHLPHSNVMATVMGQRYLENGLWEISLKQTFGFSGKAEFVVYFDKPIEHREKRTDFMVIIRHADRCRDANDREYYFICEGVVFEQGPKVKFIADHHTPNAD